MQMKARGVALVVALVAVLVVSGVTVLLFTRTMGEIRHSRDNLSIVQTLMLARGVATTGGRLLSGPVRERLNAVVRDTARDTGRWSYGMGAGNAPDPVSVASDLAKVASRLQGEVDGMTCTLSPVPAEPSLAGRLRIHFTPSACGEGLPPRVRLPSGRFVEGTPRTGTGAASNQTYALPFVMVAEGLQGESKRRVILQGEFRFTVGRSSFARYALFTNVHTLSEGTEIWFTGRTLFDGPVHTNSNFRFYRNPWFGGEVTSAGCQNPGASNCQGRTTPGGVFYGVGLVPPDRMSPSAANPSYTNAYGTHAPEFTSGVDWNASFVPLPQNNQDQKAAAQQAGLYFANDVQQLFFSLQTDGLGLKYQYIRVTACKTPSCNQTETKEYRYQEDRLLYEKVGNAWIPVVRNGSPVYFNGVIFVEGAVQDLRGPDRTRGDDPQTAGPALAEFAQITVAANQTLKITRDLKYEAPPCTGVPTRLPNGTVQPASCDNLGARNVLGLYSQNGDVLISRDAPSDITIHGVLMSGRGVVGVEDYNTIPAKGEVRLLGGLIEYYYGAFGTFDSQTGQNRTGYGRRFTYDRRMLQGLAPPLFPTTGQDRVLSVSLFSYGQREQVY